MAFLGEVQWLFWGKYNGPSGGTTMAPVGKSQKPHFASKWFPDRLLDVFETSPNNQHFPNISEMKIENRGGEGDAWFRLFSLGNGIISTFEAHVE